MGKWIGFGVGTVVVAVLAHLVYYRKTFTSADGKFLGLVPENPGFGLDEILAGALLLGGATLAIRLTRGMGVPARLTAPV